MKKLRVRAEPRSPVVPFLLGFVCLAIGYHLGVNDVVEMFFYMAAGACNYVSVDRWHERRVLRRGIRNYKKKNNIPDRCNWDAPGICACPDCEHKQELWEEEYMRSQVLR